MTLQQMFLVLPDLPKVVAILACQYAVEGKWARFRDYLRSRRIDSLVLRREAFDAAQLGHSPDLVTAEDVAAEAARGFPNLACMECAASVQEALQARAIPGTILDLDTGRAQGMYGNIWSDRLNKVIAYSGRHRAVRVADTVFDNHNPNGIVFQRWRVDFVSPGYPVPGTIPLQETAF